MTTSTPFTTKTAALACAALILAGCAGMTGGNVYPAVAPVPEGSEIIHFNAPGLAENSALRAEYKDNYQEEEYVLYKGDRGAQAEVLYVFASHYGYGVSGGDRVVLDFAKITKDTLLMWNMVRNANVVYGESKPYDGELPYYIQPFQRQDSGQNCFGFHSEFNLDGHDPDNRYDSHLFGYYCAPRGTQISRDDMHNAIDKLELAGVTERASTAVTEREFKQLQHDAQLAQAVRTGVPAKETGMPAFPLDIAQIYMQRANGDGDKQ